LKPIEHIDLAIKDLTTEVGEILQNSKLSLTEKDSEILPLLQQKRVLQQAKEDLEYLESREKEINSTCKMSQFRT
jgi:hypothetical protein